MLEWTGPRKGVPRMFLQRDAKVIDYADDVGHARYITAEYRIIYGSNWRVSYEKNV